ncbi:MAG: hypothetical protein F4X98_09625 [Gammaproteobacteria bacterium]|nr:hypothetical protein [Gammaproteobacteria bacterium]
MTRSMKCALLVVGLTIGLPPLADEVAKGSVLMQAMRDELARSMEQLQLADAEKPYFLAYRVHETTSSNASASLGGLLNVSSGFGRQLVVELRVGDYDFDNTNFMSMTRPTGMAPVVVSLSVDDNYDTLRRQIWLATDTAYKRAWDQLGAKRAALQNQTQVEKVPDFSREEPYQYDGLTQAGLDTEPISALAVEVSAAMRGMAHLSRSEVRVGASLDRTWFVNSEGSEFVRETPFVGLQALAGSQADDGTEIQDAVAVRGRRWEDLPDAATLVDRVRAMAGRLAERREAPYLDRYSGPVLFEGQAAAELVSQVLAPRLISFRLPTLDTPQAEQLLAQYRNPFLDKIGSRVLPRFLSVTTDATLKEYEGVPLHGHQVVDDDAVPTRPILLIERGALKTLLSTRVPLAELPQSSGSRWRDTPMPSNLFVNATRGLEAEELNEELFALVADFGVDHAVVVRRIGTRLARFDFGAGGAFSVGGESSRVEPLIEAYKVFPDGRKELLRLASLPTIAESDFKDIVAVSAATSLHDAGFSPASAAGMPGMIGGPSWPISVSTPALLFEELTVKRPTGSIPKPPVTPHPLAKTLQPTGTGGSGVRPDL